MSRAKRFWPLALATLAVVATALAPARAQTAGDSAAPALAPAPAAGNAAAPPSAAGDAATDTAKPVKIVEIIGKSFAVGQTTEALVAPPPRPAHVVRVRQGADIHVVGLVEGDAWYQIELPDKRIAYVPVAAIPAAAAPSGAASPPIPAATVAEPPAALPPTQEAAAAEDITNDLPTTTEFDEANDQLRVVTPTAVFLAPNKRAPQAYSVKVGTMVEVIAKSKDGVWAWVTTADHMPAYIPLSDLGPSPSAQ